MTPVRYSADERVIEPSSSVLTEVVSYLGSWSNEAMLRVFETLVKNIENNRRSEPQLEEEFPPRIFHADPESEEIDLVGISSQDESQQEDVVDATTIRGLQWNADVTDAVAVNPTRRRRSHPLQSKTSMTSVTCTRVIDIRRHPRRSSRQREVAKRGEKEELKSLWNLSGRHFE